MESNFVEAKNNNKSNWTIVINQKTMKMKMILLIYLKLFLIAHQCSDKVFQLRFMENSMFKVNLCKLETFTPKVFPKN